MHMTIVSNNLQVSSKQRVLLIERARQTFRRLVNRIEGVTATFVDVNGPKGGIDTMCKLQVSVPKGKNILVTATQENIFSAFAKALAKAKQQLTKLYSRKKATRYLTPKPKSLNSAGVETLAEHRWQRKELS